MNPNLTRLRRFSAGLVVAAMVLCAHAQDRALNGEQQSGLEPQANKDQSGAFYRRGEEGWFWYQDPPKEEEEKPEKPKPKPPKNVEKIEVPPSPEKPEKMTVKWFQQNLETVMNRAIDNPTDENVAAYFFLQKVMYKKSEQFARASADVARKYPELDQRNKWQGGRENRNRQNEHQEEILRLLGTRMNKADAGVWFFFGEDAYSQQVASSVQMIEVSSDVPVYAFSMTDKEPGKSVTKWFPDYRVDEGQAETSHVDKPPAVVLAIPPNEIEPIAYGNIGRSKLEDRLVKAAHSRGFVTDKELSQYRGIQDEYDTLDPNELPPPDEIDTDEIMEVMREAFQ